MAKRLKTYKITDHDVERLDLAIEVFKEYHQARQLDRHLERALYQLIAIIPVPLVGTRVQSKEPPGAA